MSQPISESTSDKTQDENIPPLSRSKTLGYSIANIGFGMFYALNNASLSLFLKHYTNNAIVLSLMSSSDSIEGVVVQPIIGAASDRMKSPLGRRRPFMLFTVPLSALFIVLTPLTANLPINIRLGIMIACIFLFTTLFNIAWSPYQALMADITPTRQRGRVTAIMTLFGVLGQASLVLLNLPLPLKFFIAAAIMLLTTLITCGLIKEPVRPITNDSRHSPWADVRVALQGLRTLAQAKKAIGVIFLAGVGIGSVFPLLTVFVQVTTKCTDHEAERMFLVLMIATAVAILPFGKLVDMWGAKRVLMIGSGLIVIASVNALWVTTLSQVSVILAIAGVGNAAQSAARYPLLTALVPRNEVGFYTGLQATAQSLALPIIAIVTGYLVNVGGYRVIFAVCAVCLALSMLVLSAIRMQDAASEITLREAQREV